MKPKLEDKIHVTLIHNTHQSDLCLVDRADGMDWVPFAGVHLYVKEDGFVSVVSECGRCNVGHLLPGTVVQPL